MSAIESTLTIFCQKIPQQYLVIAYSGGVDSQVLLHALALLKAQGKISQAIDVCHINHGLSENSRHWQIFAEQQCQALKLPFLCIGVDVDTEAKQSIEALARDARYQALQGYAPKDAAILTGHHLDDQSETFLLALKRGSGLKGLAAMKPTMALGEHTLARPLLTLTRAEIVAYAQHNKLEWIEDESNQDLQFDRNFLRHQVMPILAQRWPSVAHTISRSAQHCQEGQVLLDELAEQDYQAICLAGEDKAEDFYCQAPHIAITGLMGLSRARFNNFLRYFLTKQQCLMPSSEQLSQVYSQLHAPADKCPAIKVGDKWLRRFQQYFFLMDNLADVSSETYLLDNLLHGLTSSVIGSTTELVLGDNIGKLLFTLTPEKSDKAKKNESLQLDKNIEPKGKKQLRLALPKTGQQVSIQFSHQNPKCLPDYRQQRRPLKKVLQELQIPPWQRQRIAFLFYDEQLVAALGYFVCQEFIPQQDCDNLCIKWQL